MILENISILKELTIWSILLRTLLAMILGGVLGYEREKKRRPAGFRTYMVVSLGSALAMMTGIYMSGQTGIGDASRIAAQVISGIGFLGAGTILVTKHQQVKGLTTAAGLWASACIGLAVGSGFYSGALIGFTAIWASLWIMQIIDRKLESNSGTISLYIEFTEMSNISAFLAYARGQGCTVRNLEVDRTKIGNGLIEISVTVTLQFPSRILHAEVIEKYGALEGVRFIEEL